MTRGSVNWEALADRAWLQRSYLPRLAGDVLWVGVERCTDFYHQLVPADCRFTTLDVDPAAAACGAPGRHEVADVLDWKLWGFYDHVAFYGIAGYCALPHDWSVYHHHLDRLVKPGGTLLLGHHVGPPHGRPLAEWRATAGRLPCCVYRTLVDAPPGVTTNWIWWGRKS